MVEFGHHLLLHDLRERVEVHHHPGSRTGRLKGSLEGDLEPVRVTVQARAASRVMRQHVGRLERERFPDLHRADVRRRTERRLTARNSTRVQSKPGGTRPDPIAPQERAEPVVVAGWDPAWEQTFAAIRTRVAAALGDAAVGIEHVGSTAVSGLDAKPIIDIDVVVRNEGDVAEAIARLATIGYEHLGDLGIIGREAFRAPAGSPAQHLFVCPASSAELRAHLIFRDALRTRPALAATYAALKHELAARYRDDRDAYAEGKSRFIAVALQDEREGSRRAQRR